MKLNKEKRNVERSLPFAQKGFGIQSNANAFDILSSRIYTDPILAVVRELSTNAVDAQVQAGNPDRAFDVHLPNVMDPYFCIRDYGTGLSEQAIQEVYTTYFCSTRGESDDYTGALGLGSKSPFAYTDMFSIVSYFDGVCYTYSAFKSEDGAPTIALLTKQDTDAPNGVEIKIQTKDADIRLFKGAAQKVYQFFDIRPNVTGQRIEYNNAEPVFEADNWKLYDTNDAPIGGAIHVTMGNVCYKVDSDHFNHIIERRGAILIDVPMGAVTFAASREELQYDKNTVAKIQKLLDNTFQSVAKLLESKLENDCVSSLAKVIALAKYKRLINLASTFKFTLSTEEKDKFSIRKAHVKSDKLFIQSYAYHSAGNLRPNEDTVYMFIEDDTDAALTQKQRNALRYYIQQNEDTSVQSCNRNVYIARIQDRARFVELYGEPEAKITTLPSPPRAQRQASGGVSRSYVKVLTGKSLYSSSARDAWGNVEDIKDIDATKGIAVRRSGNRIIFNGSVYLGRDGVIKIAQGLGYEFIYGITDSKYEKMTKALGLKNLEKEWEGVAEKFVKGMNEADRSRYHHGEGNYLSSKIVNCIKGLSPACDRFLSLKSKNDMPNHIRVLMQLFQVKVPDAPNYSEEFYQRYPLLSHINDYYVSSQDVVEYVQLIENKS